MLVKNKKLLSVTGILAISFLVLTLCLYPVALSDLSVDPAPAVILDNDELDLSNNDLGLELTASFANYSELARRGSSSNCCCLASCALCFPSAWW
jgi:hypothetical protein